VGEGVIEYLGDVEDVRPALADSAVLVLPSYRKGLRRSALEAMSMAMPVVNTLVVTTDVPGCRETLIDRLNVCPASARAVPAVAQAMAGFIDPPDARDAVAPVGAASRERMTARFSAACVKARILVVLRECLE
jgi:glycosyltransferase involved in cell wall biosynthesis